MMHLHLVSTQCKGQTGMSVACDDVETHERSLEPCAPIRCEPPADEREARLAALYARVRSGSYQIDCHAIAERVLDKTGQFYLERSERKIGEMSEWV
ncbi:MAG TPA: flagellar biosynthesis anti-sigma factor FlgM [Ktedonobacteraceae bacterium]|jgi:anti-sigma28 factor (negative regulator of flagellin synthesis)